MIEITYTDERFPMSAVKWEVSSADRSKIVIDQRMVTHPRFSYFETRLTPTLALLEAAHATGALVPASLMLNLEDKPAVPGMAFCSASSGDLLIPDAVFMRLNGYAKLREIWARRPIPWGERAVKVFWRGAASGKSPDGDWRNLPRVRLCEIAGARPELFDVGIARASPAFEEAGLGKPFVPDVAMLEYRYHVDIDGNTNSWPGLFLKLLTGAPVLKVASPGGYRQWYYDRLVPWVNYVPVASDMSDLIERAEWIGAHTDEAMAIGAAGKRLADALTYDAEVLDAGRRIAQAVVMENSAAWVATPSAPDADDDPWNERYYDAVLAPMLALPTGGETEL